MSETRDGAVGRNVYVGPEVSETSYGRARATIASLRTPSGLVLGDVIARLVLDCGAVVAAEGVDDDTPTQARSDDRCAEHRGGLPGEPHEWRRGRRGRTKVVTCVPLLAATASTPDEPCVHCGTVSALVVCPDHAAPTPDEVGQVEGLSRLEREEIYAALADDPIINMSGLIAAVERILAARTGARA